MNHVDLTTEKPGDDCVASVKPADIVIARFNGARELARLLGKDPSTIHRWRMPAAKGGLDGRVPSAVQVRLLELAASMGVQLTAAELINGGPVCVGIVQGAVK